ncbi:MAG TPA: GNAT family N-acetyltransferase [Candidatus Binatia bacterium]|nr:GNAT family N-acetyltransferase [Candidatus Binatia bacterium]
MTGGRFTTEIDTIAPTEWDAVVAAFDDVSCEQTAAWTDARWGARRSSHLLLRRDGVPVGGARVVVLQWPGIRRGIAYVKYGPFWRARGARPDVDVYRRCIEALFREYGVRRNHCLSVLPRPNPDHERVEVEALGALGFVVRRPMVDPNRYLVDVQLDAAERLQSLDQKWRYNLRQAQRRGIECHLDATDEAFATFAALHARMVARKRFRNGDALHLVPILDRSLPEAMRPRVVLGFLDGTAVAGAVVVEAGDTAYYLYGASDEAALGSKAGYALQWWIVEWLAGRGVRWYDLGGEARDPGLRQFKKGLVGKRGAIVTAAGEFDRWTSRGGRLAADVIYGLRDAVRRLHRARPVRVGVASPAVSAP